jgi:hypothetical protein
MTEKKLKTVNIKGKDYVEVNTRVKEFRTNDLYKGFRLVTEIIDLTNGVVTMKASVINDKGEVIATGHAQEKESSSYINKTSFIENCETSAWGRALGNLGIGIDTSIASCEEVQNAIENQEKAKTVVATKPQPTAKAKAKAPQTENVDMTILKGLQDCQTMDELKAYYQENYNKVGDKQAFVELKNARKSVLESA